MLSAWVVDELWKKRKEKKPTSYVPRRIRGKIKKTVSDFQKPTQTVRQGTERKRSLTFRTERKHR